MSEHIERSQKGGDSAKLVSAYERSFIEFLCARLICGKEEISEIICEYRNDIEVKRNNKALESYQIKSTTKNTLNIEEVESALNLFNILNRVDNYSQFVVVTNRNPSNFNLQVLSTYTLEEIPGLNERILKRTNHQFDDSFLSKVRFMKGPEFDIAGAVVRDELSCLPNRDSVFKNLFSFIVNVWNRHT